MCDGFQREMGKALLAYIGFFSFVFIVGTMFKTERLPVHLTSRQAMEVPGGQERLLKAHISRDSNGVIHVKGDEWVDSVFGLGYGHGQDRWQQMCILRLLGQGRLSEVLKSTDTTLYLDRYIRKLGFAERAPKVAKLLTQENRSLLKAYAAGVNENVKDENRPPLFLLLNYHPEPWTLDDIILVGMVMPFFGLADSQVKAERLIMESIQTKLGENVVRYMFKPFLDELDDELVTLMKKVNLEEYFNGKKALLQDFIGSPGGGGSNNWAISPQFSKSGKSMYASDPHLQIDRLPAIWAESVMSTKDNHIIGIACPGAPVIAMARTQFISYGFTYALSDTLDFMIEDCKTEDGKVLCKSTDGQYKEAKKFTTTIKQKGKEPIDYTWWETEFGMLELDPSNTSPNGYYLSMAYSNREKGTLGAIEGFMGLLNAKSVKEAQETVKNVDYTINIVITDDDNIGQSVTGNIPKRNYSGLFPKRAWLKENHWDGFVDQSLHFSDYNPERGFIATANNDWNNKESGIVSMNAHLGPYRADRIVEMIRSKIKEKGKLDMDDMKDIQCDVFSKQGEAYMKKLKPILDDMPSGPVVDLLTSWDMRYEIDSQGATVFERFLRNIYVDVYGRVYGEEGAGQVVDRFPFKHHMDRVILDYDQTLSELWQSESQQKLFKRVLDKTLSELQGKEILGVGYDNPVEFKNIFYGFLPKSVSELVGINQVIPIAGSVATVAQKNSIKSPTGPRNGGVSWRLLSDHYYSQVQTSLPGGAQEQPFYRHYKNDLQRWSQCQYKTLEKH